MARRNAARSPATGMMNVERSGSACLLRDATRPPWMREIDASGADSRPQWEPTATRKWPRHQPHSESRRQTGGIAWVGAEPILARVNPCGTAARSADRAVRRWGGRKNGRGAVPPPPAPPRKGSQHSYASLLPTMPPSRPQRTSFGTASTPRRPAGQHQRALRRLRQRRAVSGRARQPPLTTARFDVSRSCRRIHRAGQCHVSMLRRLSASTCTTDARDRHRLRQE